jgi:S-adenosylmethionine:tRNA ribosyltransferase-isomerase
LNRRPAVYDTAALPLSYFGVWWEQRKKLALLPGASLKSAPFPSIHPPHPPSSVPLPTHLFDYDLPAHLIAQTPAARRDSSRLLVVDRATRTVAHHLFSDLPQFLRGGDILFRNNAAVLPARLNAQRPTGGAVECFLTRPEPARGENVWWCLIRPGKKLPVGATFAHGADFTGEVLEKNAEGGALIRFTIPSGEAVTALANRLGEVPLPPYITRTENDLVAHRAQELERYQTVYANRDRQVAVAAPTAGLHFTPELLARLTALGIGAADITLHVGLGTFKPIMAETVEEHAIHRELYELPAATQQALFAPSGRRIAVGTTSVRTIEDFLSHHRSPLAQPHFAEAGIFIYPPRTFAGVDALITNFHQPRSTLLCLVSAFLTPASTDGIAWLKQIYAEAIAREYRFFSYGDAMLIL